MTGKKLKFTVALVLIVANLFLGTGFASAESAPMFFNISPRYMYDLWIYLAGLPQEEYAEAEAEEEFIHVVVRGENLIRIARRYDMDAGVLAAINGIEDPDLILVGQELKVTMPQKITHTLARGETLAYLAQAYGVDLDDLKITNDIVDSTSLPVGMVLTIFNPTKFPPPPEPATTVASRSGGSTARVSSAPSFVWPLRGTITSRFGVLRSTGYHWGLDIAAASGSPISAAAGGTVVQAERLGSYGLMLVVDHGNGWSTLYAHASSLLVSTGQRVAQGEKIALVGATGNATGPHLHLEVIHQGKKLNPMTYLP